MPLRPDMMLPPANPLPDLAGLPVHLMGIGGQGMKPIALAARAVGAQVSGCDLVKGVDDPEFTAAGIAVEADHDATHAHDAHVVISSAIQPRFDETTVAAAAGRLHHRAELLDAVLRNRASITVTGTHGKGTVAALVGIGLADRDADPMVIVGAALPQLNGQFRAGGGPVVAEADDADGSIARVHSEIAVVTNSWFDHPVFKRTRQEVFADVATHVGNATRAVVLGPGANLRPLESAAGVPVLRVGRDVRVRTMSVTPDARVIRLREPGGVSVDAQVRYLGGGVADNAATAYLALRALGYAPPDAAAAIGALTGIRRRLHRIDTANGVAIYDDLGKHPAAVQANLAVLREVTDGRIHVMYEPFLHTDLVRWKRDWARVLSTADSVTVLPIDPAPGFPGEPVAPSDWPQSVGLDATVVGSRDEGIESAAARATPGDAVVVMGSMNDLTDVARRVANAIRASH